MGGTKTDDVVAIKGEQKLQEILTAAQLNTVPYETATDFRKWFLQYFCKKNCKSDDISLEQFAIFYLNAVRQHSYQHLRATVEAIDKMSTTSAVLAQKQPTAEQTRPNRAILPATPDSNALPSIQNLQICSTKCSTPLRRGTGQRRSIERSFGATSNSSYEKSRNSTGGDGSFCLGDFIVSSPNISGGRHGGSHKKKSHSAQTQQQVTAALPSTTAAATPKSNSGNKPKKRVVPISIGSKATTSLTAIGDSNSPFGVHGRSFDRDCNNLFMHTPTMEVSDLAEARKSLKRDLNEVSTALKAATPTKTPTKLPELAQAMQQAKLQDTNIAYELNCLSQISNAARLILRLLANIYGMLMDMNFVINVLNEFSFLMNLLNANLQTLSTATKQLEPLEGLRMLQLNFNCIYFAVCVLECQQHALVQLDTKSLGVVLQCERLERLAPLLKAKLSAAYEQKQALPYQLEQLPVMAADSSFKNVCFQEDSDSRKFFSSTAEFAAFKTQRDLFYIVLKEWEKHHLNPAWSFNSELAPRVREIFRQSEHSVNMAHFAKLFVSQLLVSASDKTSPEDLGFGNEDVDLQKFNKLAQRLVAPSNFSVDYQFPREQAFFRDFIVESRSLSFLEQLKMVIFGELITLNDSTLEHLNLNLMTANEERDHDLHDRSEFVVEPTVLSSMLILAKFLGFTMALPYQSVATAAGAGSEQQNYALIQRYQLKMRQLFRAPFDVCQLLDVAMASGRLLITLPWLVQYMAMLDAVTLQLSTYVSALQKMFALYAAMGGTRNEALKLQRVITPMSGFIVRCCLGWLFEQKPGIAAEYYNFRASIYHESYDVALVLETLAPSLPSDQQLLAVLESVLAVACPYLAEFRVSIMPAKHALTKNVSRSGRYRHITPSIAESPSLKTVSELSTNQARDEQLSQNVPLPVNSQHDSNNAAKQRQRKLMESFLHAQNSSMRRLIVFLTERTYKCVIKDAQHQILLPSKTAADSCVNEISSNNYEFVFTEVKSIYRAARAEAIQKWDNEVPGMLKKRVTQGLEALLPVETTAIVKKAYAWRIQSDANIKISQWRHMNLFKHDFYCNDLEELAEKLCKANTNRPKQTNGGAQQSTELKLIKATPSISDLLEELQHWLYITSGMSKLNIAPEECPTSELTQPTSIDQALIDFLLRLKDSFENVLPTIYYRLIGAGLIQVLQHLITTQPAALTPTLIKNFCDFCLDKRMQSADERSTNATTQTKQSDNEQTNSADPPSSSSCSSSSAITTMPVNTIYCALISAPFIQALNARSTCFDKVKELLLALIESQVISIDFVNELFVGVFKQDLPADTLNETSKLLSELASEVAADSQNCSNDFDDDLQKSKLFMEVLAEFSRDIDDF